MIKKEYAIELEELSKIHEKPKLESFIVRVL